MDKTVSLQTLQRMPAYLNYLKSLSGTGEKYVSAKLIADALWLGEIQVRKDLAAVSGGGKPKIGYNRKELIRDIESFLGYNNINDAVIVGAGRLGKAFLSYPGFKDYGLNIVAAFDIDDTKIGLDDESGKQIMPLDKMQSLCRQKKIRIGIITVPAEAAQLACDMLIESGIEAIWNFAPAHIKAPANILIKNENVAVSLTVLSRYLSDRSKSEEE